MTAMKRTGSLPRSVDELDALAAHYDTHDTSSEMEHGEWVDPRPKQRVQAKPEPDVKPA